MLRLSLFSPHARPLLLAVASPEPEGGALPHTVNSLSQGALTASTAPGTPLAHCCALLTRRCVYE